MKEILKHRIDRLMERAVTGDTDAQLDLAKEFVKGNIVEKSLENARYWAFKAVSGGNTPAIKYYNSIASDFQPSCSDKADKLLAYTKWIPWIEFIGAIILLNILSCDETTVAVLVWFIIIGIVSLILKAIMSKYLYFAFHLSPNKCITLTILITHIVGLAIAFSS